MRLSAIRLVGLASLALAGTSASAGVVAYRGLNNAPAGQFAGGQLAIAGTSTDRSYNLMDWGVGGSLLEVRGIGGFTSVYSQWQNMPNFSFYVANSLNDALTGSFSHIVPLTRSAVTPSAFNGLDGDWLIETTLVPSTGNAFPVLSGPKWVGVLATNNTGGDWGWVPNPQQDTGFGSAWSLGPNIGPAAPYSDFPGYGLGTVGYDIEVSVIPAPAGVVAFSVAGLAMLRRRR
jgi:hypothetical protein